MTKLTDAQKTQTALDERKFKSAVVTFACGIYTDAMHEGVGGDEVKALRSALDNVNPVGPETLRELAWGVQHRLEAHRAETMGPLGF